MTTTTRPIRQGLPRHPGGDPWPPASSAVVATPTPTSSEPTDQPEVVTSQQLPVQAPSAVITTSTVTASTGFTRADLRQGLPRVRGGQPWPPRGEAAIETYPPAAPPVVKAAPQPVPTPMKGITSADNTGAQPNRSAPLQSAGVKPAGEKTDTPRYGPLTIKQWVIAAVVTTFAAVGLATTIVLATRTFLGIDAVAEFVERYPGEYHLPETAPVGIPGWLAWQHFFNMFLMVLIIRTGLQVRRQQKPPAYWASKRSPKISINLWLHLSLDVLWLVNGVVFIVLLIVTGHWMRIVPSSWEVFPNAISAGLQYMSLDWPTENGWVNYNSLQQLAYFTTVFIAAPLAAVSGFRMSAFWPAKSATLNRIYPAELARALHFPVMIYFVVFIFIHVALVLSTGALRNLNHMYAAQGSVDPTQFAANWTGFWLFSASLLVIITVWVVCRPMLLAPVARLFGTVSMR